MKVWDLQIVYEDLEKFISLNGGVKNEIFMFMWTLNIRYN